ncbi:MAG: YDG domain-containing protein [Lachnospiraceae bacterium]|nr:YDG domain-containing protein [Lachnospiraceae bacterium]
MKRKLLSVALSISLLFSAVQLPVFAGEAGQTNQTVSDNSIAVTEEVSPVEEEGEAVTNKRASMRVGIAVNSADETDTTDSAGEADTADSTAGADSTDSIDGGDSVDTADQDMADKAANTQDGADAAGNSGVTDAADGVNGQPPVSEEEEKKGSETVSDNQIDSSGDAEETTDKEGEETAEEELLCICEEQCSQDKVNEDCPVCSLEDADLAACTGKPVKIMMARAMVLPAAASTNTIYVGNNDSGDGSGTKDDPYKYLNKAVEKAVDGTTIILLDGAWCDSSGATGGDPLTFNHQVTIQGDPDSQSKVTLHSRCGGYVLGADVTFRNFDFDYQNIETNGIFANGHKLTIENVGNSGSRKVDIYAGGLGVNSTVATGSVVEISGSQTVLGTIYGGGFSQNAAQNWGDKEPASEIRINGAVNLTGIRANGVQKIVRPGTVSQYAGQISQGTLMIKLTDVTSTLDINGMLDNTTNPNNMANVEVTSTGSSINGLSFSNLRKLTVVQGKVIPKALNEGVDISVQSGAILDLGPAIDNINSGGSYQNFFEINNFDGGGTLRIKEEYRLTILGNVSGTTNFQSTLLQASEDRSGYVTKDTAYIKTLANVADNAFTFTPIEDKSIQDQSNYRLKKIVEGNWAQWTIKEDSTTPPATKQDLAQAVVSVSGTFTYSGSSQTPQAGAVTVTLNGTPVPSDAYDISAADNTKAGNATITVTAKADSSYTGTATGTYRIEPRIITVSATPQTIFYGQKTVQPTYTISNGTMVNGETLSGSLEISGNSITQGTLTNQNNPNYNITFNGANVTVKETTPVIDISSSHTVQKAGGEVEIEVKVSNPYDSTLQDYGTPALTWRIGNGAKQTITNNRFTIPQGTAKDTVITVEAAITRVANKYAAKTAAIQVTVTDKAIADDKLVLNVEDLEYGVTPNFQVQFMGTASGNAKTGLTYSNDSGISFKALADLQNTSGQLPAGTYQVKARYEDDAQIGEITKTFEVTKKRLTLGMDVSGVTKTYNGTTRVEGTMPTLSIRGMVTGENPSLNEGAVSYNYEDAGAGTGKTVVASGLTLKDTAVNKNYTIPTTISAAGAVILPREADLSFTSEGTSHKAGEKVGLTVQVKDKSAAPLPGEAGSLTAITVTDGEGNTVAMGNTGNGRFTGSYTIPVGKRPGESITLKAVTKDSNYKEATAQITLTVAEGGVNPPVDPKPETKMNIDIKNGISQVPDSLKTALNITSSGELENIMRAKITQAGTISTSNTAVYDVSLLISADDGRTWEKATKDNFPRGGVEVVLPYPAGTGKDTHDFTVVHMFTEEMNGYKPGEIETPAVIKDDTGVRVTVTGLSPISLGWREIKKTDNQPTQPSGNSGQNQTSGGNTGGGDAGQGSSPAPVKPVYNEAEFWKNIERILRGAKDGDTVKVNAGGYNYMPQHVMKTLKERGTITLELSWNGGGTITIPAGKALDNQVEQYALAELEKTDFNQPQQMVLSQQSQTPVAGSPANREVAVNNANTTSTANTTAQKKGETPATSDPAKQEDKTETTDQLLAKDSDREEAAWEETGRVSQEADSAALAETEENTPEEQKKQDFGIQWFIIGGILVAAVGILASIAVKKGKQNQEN